VRENLVGVAHSGNFYSCAGAVAAGAVDEVVAVAAGCHAAHYLLQLMNSCNRRTGFVHPAAAIKTKTKTFSHQSISSYVFKIDI
jgi:hypothetical protein